MEKSLEDFNYYFEYLPWSLSNYVLYPNEIERLFYFFTNGKTSLSDKVEGKLNKYVNFAIQNKQENNSYSVLKDELREATEPAYSY